MVLAGAPATIHLLRRQHAARRRADVDPRVAADVRSEPGRAAGLGGGDEREAVGTRQPASRRRRQPPHHRARLRVDLGRDLRAPRVREERQASDAAASLGEPGGEAPTLPPNAVTAPTPVMTTAGAKPGAYSARSCRMKSTSA